MKIALLGGGIGGLAAALFLHRAGIDCQVYEAADEYRPIGAGINLLPHAVKMLSEIGLDREVAKAGIEPSDFLYFNQFGQEIFSEPCGLRAGFTSPHYSIHRADFHEVLLKAVRERLGHDNVLTGHRVSKVDQDDTGVTVQFVDSKGAQLPAAQADLAIACDGIHSAVRRQFYPQEGPPAFGGIHMWRGVTRHTPVLGGDKCIRIGPLRTGKLVVYPVRNYPDGTQLVNWVVEVQGEPQAIVDWSKPGKLEDFLHYFAGWHFDWLDVPKLLSQAEMILEYPMADRDPIDQWTFGRITLLGDAAHPMYPRGANGAAQSLLDAQTIATLLKTNENPLAALQTYEAQRRPPTSKIVQTNRSQPPDYIIESVDRMAGGKPFNRIEDVVSPEQLMAIAEEYRRITGGNRDSVNAPATSSTSTH